MAEGIFGSLIGGAADLFGARLKGISDNKAARLNAIIASTAAANANAQNAEQFDRTYKESVRQYERNFKEAQAQLDRQYKEDRHDEARADYQAERDRQIAQQFAQMGVQWRVQDARNAGIHPLAALGMNPSNAPAVNISGGNTLPQGNVPAGQMSPTTGTQQVANVAPFVGTDYSGSFSRMGQDLSRAIAAVSTEDERARGVKEASEQLALENQKLQNQYLGSQIAKLNAQVPPASPMGTRQTSLQGQPAAIKGTKVNPIDVDVEARPGTVPGESPTIQYYAGPRAVHIAPAPQFKKAVEDSAGEVIWDVTTRVNNGLGRGTPPPASLMARYGGHPDTHQWIWDQTEDGWKVKRMFTMPKGMNPNDPWRGTLGRLGFGRYGQGSFHGQGR